MVLSKSAVLALFIAACASAQFATPVIIQATNSVQSCVRLYEQRTIGNNFVNICAPNSITTDNSLFLPNISAGGTLMVAPTAANPITNFFATNSYAEVFKVALPGSTFGTAWSIQLNGADILDFLNTGGTRAMAINQADNNTLFTSAVKPLADNVYVLGTPALRWNDGNFGGVVTAQNLKFTASLLLNTTTIINSAGFFGLNVSPSSDNTFDLGTTSTLDWKNINFQGALIQNGTSRISSTGVLNVGGLGSDLIPTTDATYSVGDSTHRIATLFPVSINGYDSATVLRLSLFSGNNGLNTGNAIQVVDAAGSGLLFRVGQQSDSHWNMHGL